MKLDTMMEAIEVLARERGVAIDTILDAFANALVAGLQAEPRSGGGGPGHDRPRHRRHHRLRPGSRRGRQRRDGVGGHTRRRAFGRIAAQSAKQVIQHKLRDAKREHVFEMYAGREGDLVTGIVQQVDGRFAILDLGDAEAILPGSERIPYERLERGNRVKALILEVRNETKGPQIVVSRSHPDLVRRLLELEVPELADGTVEIVTIAREPGHRTKIAVVSHDPNVDPKGACVGARGSRVRQVVNELRGEKVDVVQWRDDIGQFIAEALGPAKVKEVRVDEENKTADVIVVRASAVPCHRQGGSERPSGGPALRIQGRHPLRHGRCRGRGGRAEAAPADEAVTREAGMKPDARAVPTKP